MIIKKLFVTVIVCFFCFSALAEDRSEIYKAQCSEYDDFWGKEIYYSYLNIVFSSDRAQLMEVKVGIDDIQKPSTISWSNVTIRDFLGFPILVARFETAERYQSPTPKPKDYIIYKAELEYSGEDLSVFTSYNFGRSNEGGWHNRTERKIICKILSKI